MSAAELTQATGSHRLVVSRDLKVLTDSRNVTRVPARGHSYEYRFRSYAVTSLPVGQSKEGILALTVEEIHSIYTEKLTRPGWEPRLAKTTRYLPHVLHRLANLAHQARLGSMIDKSDLTEQKQHLNELLGDLNQMRKVVGGLLATEKLWSPKDFAVLLPEIETDVNAETERD